MNKRRRKKKLTLRNKRVRMPRNLVVIVNGQAMVRGHDYRVVRHFHGRRRAPATLQFGEDAVLLPKDIVRIQYSFGGIDHEEIKRIK